MSAGISDRVLPDRQDIRQADCSLRKIHNAGISYAYNMCSGFQKYSAEDGDKKFSNTYCRGDRDQYSRLLRDSKAVGQE